MRVIVLKYVRRQIQQLPHTVQFRIWSALEHLQDHWIEGKKLEGDYAGCRVIRVWPYRIIYEVRKRELIIVILRIADRKDVYR